MADLFLDGHEFGNAHSYAERAKSHTADNLYHLGCALELQARIWYRQRRLKEAKSEALRAFDTFEIVGAANSLADCRALLRDIEQEVSLGESGSL